MVANQNSPEKDGGGHNPHHGPQRVWITHDFKTSGVGDSNYRDEDLTARQKPFEKPASLLSRGLAKIAAVS